MEHGIKVLVGALVLGFFVCIGMFVQHILRTHGINISLPLAVANACVVIIVLWIIGHITTEIVSHNKN